MKEISKIAQNTSNMTNVVNKFIVFLYKIKPDWLALIDQSGKCISKFK